MRSFHSSFILGNLYSKLRIEPYWLTLKKAFTHQCSILLLEFDHALAGHREQVTGTGCQQLTGPATLRRGGIFTDYSLHLPTQEDEQVVHVGNLVGIKQGNGKALATGPRNTTYKKDIT